MKTSSCWINKEASSKASPAAVSPSVIGRVAAELMHEGLLSRTAGSYRLGAKIIELEYLISTYDPVIRAVRGLMNGLAETTGCNVLLCNVYDGNIVNVFHATGRHAVAVAYTKGLPMPLFRGSQAHMIIAWMDRRRLRRLFDASIADPALRKDVQAIGADWTAFTKALRQIRARGY